jgi:hypothetical protein
VRRAGGLARWGKGGRAREAYGGLLVLLSSFLGCTTNLQSDSERDDGEQASSVEERKRDRINSLPLTSEQLDDCWQCYRPLQKLARPLIDFFHPPTASRRFPLPPLSSAPLGRRRQLSDARETRLGLASSDSSRPVMRDELQLLVRRLDPLLSLPKLTQLCLCSSWAPQLANRLSLTSTQTNLIGAGGNMGVYLSCASTILTGYFLLSF